MSTRGGSCAPAPALGARSSPGRGLGHGCAPASTAGRTWAWGAQGHRRSASGGCGEGWVSGSPASRPRVAAHGRRACPVPHIFLFTPRIRFDCTSEMRNWMSCRGRGGQPRADRAPLPAGPAHTLLTTFCCWACFCLRLATSRHSASFSLQQTRRGQQAAGALGHPAPPRAHPLAHPCPLPSTGQGPGRDPRALSVTVKVAEPLGSLPGPRMGVQGMEAVQLPGHRTASGGSPVL